MEPVIKKNWEDIGHFEIWTKTITGKSCQLLFILLISDSIKGCL